MRRIALAAGCVLLAVAGCSSTASTATPTGATPSSSTSPDTIVIQDFSFHPASLSIAPGTTVTVINKDAATHTVTSTSNPKAFDTGDLAPGATTTFRAPAAAGVYPYICEIHQYMQGSLTVQ